MNDFGQLASRNEIGRPLAWVANGRPMCVESPRSECLLAGVPESLSIARVGVIPAQSRRGRLARIGDGRARGQDADRSAGRDRAAGAPAIPARSRPATIASPVDSGAAIDAAAVGPASVRAATIAA